MDDIKYDYENGGGHEDSQDQICTKNISGCVITFSSCPLVLISNSPNGSMTINLTCHVCGTISVIKSLVENEGYYQNPDWFFLN